MNAKGALGLCQELTRLYAAGSAKGSDGSQFALGGCSTLNNLATLKRMFDQEQPRRTLEVGFCLGGSGLLFTALHRQTGAAPNGQHTAIDPFQVRIWKRAGLLAVERAGLSSYLDFRESVSSLELPQLCREGRKFDMIYVDGSHLFEDVFIDAFFSAMLLEDNGVVVFDDSTDPHVKKVLQFLRTNWPGVLRELDLGQYREDFSIAYRVGRMFGRVQMTAFRRVGLVERQWNTPFRSF